LGASGAGKSTTADILLGLLEPDEGEILFNGQPVTADDIKIWRSRMGYVAESPYLLDDSVVNNIVFGEDEANADRLIWAAGVAGLDDVFGELTKESLDVMVGQYGTNLSNGQKQRIAIARALYRNPDLLILDEATNGLDLISESRLLKSLSALPELTLIFISHRPSIMKFCRQLIIFQQGTTVANGTYEELVLHPEYKDLLA
jgi:ABC-type multidrug transport system fused ATPase/permease subunit